MPSTIGPQAGHERGADAMPVKLFSAKSWVSEHAATGPYFLVEVPW